MSLRLILMRHGHAAEGYDDHNRPLTPRGRDEARTTAIALAGHPDFLPQVLLVSDARRTRETARVFSAALERQQLDVREVEALYLAPPQVLAQSVLEASRRIGHGPIMVVAHNPGLSDWAAMLTRTYVGLSTAEAVLLVTEADAWDAALQGPNFRLVAKL